MVAKDTFVLGRSCVLDKDGPHKDAYVVVSEVSSAAANNTAELMVFASEEDAKAVGPSTWWLVRHTRVVLAPAQHLMSTRWMRRWLDRWLLRQEDARRDRST